MNVEKLRDHLCATYPDLCPYFSTEFGDGVLVIDPAQLHDTARDLKELGFDRLGMVTAVDFGEKFEMVYRFVSRSMSAAILVKCSLVRDEPRVRSLSDLWPAALWQERETYDMFGIVFDGHPDLRRILLPDDWEGYPLRKDYRNPSVIRRPDYI